MTWVRADNAALTKTETVRYLTVKNVGEETTSTTFDLYCGDTPVAEKVKFSSIANANAVLLGSNIVEFPAGTFYDQGDTYFNSAELFMIGAKNQNGTPATKYVANGGGCVSYKGMQLQNRANGTPLRSFYFENFEFDGSQQKNQWGHLLTLTCYGIDAEFVNVKFSGMTQASRTSVLGIWANDTRDDGSYPSKTEDVSVNVRLTKCVVENCNSKPVVQFQSFTPAVVSANPDCYSAISVVADADSITGCGLTAANAFCTQNGNNLNDGIHSAWTFNGETVTVPGQTAAY